MILGFVDMSYGMKLEKMVQLVQFSYALKQGTF